jgi:hypothetical protein
MTAGVPVSFKAVVARVRRALAKDGERLIVPGSQWQDAIVVDQNNVVVREVFSPLGYAKEHGLLRPYEYVAD